MNSAKESLLCLPPNNLASSPLERVNLFKWKCIMVFTMYSATITVNKKQLVGVSSCFQLFILPEFLVCARV